MHAHSPQPAARSLVPLLLLAALLTAAFALACRLTAHRAVAEVDPADGVAEQLLGGGRLLAGDLCFEEADLYLHRGMPHLKPEAFHGRWLQHLAAAVSPRMVQHREGAAGLRDVLPWVTLAARFAPTNSDFVLTQAYLLERTGNTTGALEAVRRGRLAAPRDPALPFEEARMQLRLGRWDAASSLLERTMRLTAAQPPSDAGTNLLAEACFLQALLRERGGAPATAAESLARAGRLKPDWYARFNNRVAALRAGARPEPPVGTLLDTYRQASRASPLCHHDNDGD